MTHDYEQKTTDEVRWFIERRCRGGSTLVALSAMDLPREVAFVFDDLRACESALAAARKRVEELGSLVRGHIEEKDALRAELIRITNSSAAHSHYMDDAREEAIETGRRLKDTSAKFVEAIRDRDALRDENARLREALRPFAERWRAMDDQSERLSGIERKTWEAARDALKESL